MVGRGRPLLPVVYAFRCLRISLFTHSVGKDFRAPATSAAAAAADDDDNDDDDAARRKQMCCCLDEDDIEVIDLRQLYWKILIRVI